MQTEVLQKATTTMKGMNDSHAFLWSQPVNSWNGTCVPSPDVTQDNGVWRLYNIVLVAHPIILKRRTAPKKRECSVLVYDWSVKKNLHQ